MQQNNTVKKTNAEKENTAKVEAEKATTLQNAKKAVDNIESTTLYGIRSDDEFKKYTAEVDWGAVFDDAVIKHLEKALRSSKKPDELIPEILFAILMVPLMILYEYLKRKNKLFE